LQQGAEISEPGYELIPKSPSRGTFLLWLKNIHFDAKDGAGSSGCESAGGACNSSCSGLRLLTEQTLAMGFGGLPLLDGLLTDSVWRRDSFSMAGCDLESPLLRDGGGSLFPGRAGFMKAVEFW